MKRKKGKTLGQALLAGTVHYAGQVEVRGGYYHDMWEAKVDGKLKEGSWLKLVREPNNRHDSDAIAVYTADRKELVGFMAKEQAAIYAPFMDIGVKIAARVFSVAPSCQPLRLQARLYIKK